MSGGRRGGDEGGGPRELRVQRQRPAAGGGAPHRGVCGTPGPAAQSHGCGRAGEANITPHCKVIIILLSWVKTGTMNHLDVNRDRSHFVFPLHYKSKA